MDAEQVAERIREDVRRRRARLLPLPADLRAAADLAFLEGAHDVYHVALSASRGPRGALAAAAKRALRRLLAPALGRQVEVNAALARLARHTAEQLDVLAERQEELRALVAAQAEELRALRAALDQAGRGRG
jgi:hypothetical protein